MNKEYRQLFLNVVFFSFWYETYDLLTLVSTYLIKKYDITLKFYIKCNLFIFIIWSMVVAKGKNWVDKNK